MSEAQWMAPLGSHGELINCNTNCEYPIEQLWKAIYMFEFMAELDKDTEKLKKKLHKYLMKVTKEDKGRRIYGIIEYLPNGFCTFNRRWSIILPGYESSYVPPEPEPVVEPEQTAQETVAETKKPRKATKRRYPSERVLIQDDYYMEFFIWYAQIKEHMNRKGYSVEKFKFMDAYKKYNIYDKLNDAEKKMIDQSHNMREGFTRVAGDIYDVFMKHFPNSTYNKASLYKSDPNHHSFTRARGRGGDFRYYGIPQTVFPFLMEDEIEELIATCELAYSYYQQKSRWHYETIKSFFDPLMEDFLKKLDMNREGRVKIDLSKAIVKENVWNRGSQYVRKEDPKTGHWYNTYETTWEQHEAWTPNAVFDVLIEQTSKIKDEKIIKILSLMGLWHPDLFPEETEGEVEEVVAEAAPEPVVETVQAEPEPELVIIEVGDKPRKRKEIGEVIEVEAEVIEC